MAASAWPPPSSALRHSGSLPRFGSPSSPGARGPLAESPARRRGSGAPPPACRTTVHRACRRLRSARPVPSVLGPPHGWPAASSRSPACRTGHIELAKVRWAHVPARTRGHPGNRCRAGPCTASPLSRERPPRSIMASMSRSRCAPHTCRRHGGYQGEALPRSVTTPPQKRSPRGCPGHRATARCAHHPPGAPLRHRGPQPGPRLSCPPAGLLQVGRRPRARLPPAPSPAPGGRSFPAPAGPQTYSPGRAAWCVATAARPPSTGPCAPGPAGPAPRRPTRGHLRPGRLTTGRTDQAVHLRRGHAWLHGRARGHLMPRGLGLRSRQQGLAVVTALRLDGDPTVRATPAPPGPPPARPTPRGALAAAVGPGPGGSRDGGRDAVREVCCTCSRPCWTVAASAATRLSSARMYAWAAGGYAPIVLVGRGLGGPWAKMIGGIGAAWQGWLFVTT